MRSEKKIKYLRKRIYDLEKKNEKLNHENETLESKLEANNNMVALKERILEDKIKTYEEVTEEHKTAIKNMTEKKQEYEQLILSAKTIQKKYETEMRNQLKRIKNQK